MTLTCSMVGGVAGVGGRLWVCCALPLVGPTGAHKQMVHQSMLEDKAEHMLTLKHKQDIIRARNEAVRGHGAGAEARGTCTHTMR